MASNSIISFVWLHKPINNSPVWYHIYNIGSQILKLYIYKLNLLKLENSNRNTVTEDDEVEDVLQKYLLPTSSPLLIMETSLVPSIQLYGYSSSPLSPPSHKGFTHTKPEKNLAPSLPRKVELPLSFLAGHPNSHKKNKSNKFRQHNLTHTSHDPFLF